MGVGILLFAVAVGCMDDASDSGAEYEPELITLTDWELSPLEYDPYEDHQPEEVLCPVSAFRIESAQLEVEMDLCNYASLQFTAQQFVAKGTAVELLLLHTGLWAPVAGQAHVSLLIDGEVFFEETPNIPAQAQFFFHETELSADLEEGAPIHVHIHGSLSSEEDAEDTGEASRHGANDWRIGYFNRKD
jgi:hypothetical protein